MSEFTRRVQARPAYDTEKGGRHGVELRWILRGPRGATQFLLYTGWLLPESLGVEGTEDFGAVWTIDYERALATYPHGPMPADLGFHAYEPTYDGQERMGSCDILTDAPGGCYYDGSGLNAARPFLRLLREGDKGVWGELESYYESLFGVVKEAG